MYRQLMIASRRNQSNCGAGQAGHLRLTPQALEPTGLQLNLGTREVQREIRSGGEWAQGAHAPRFLASVLDLPRPSADGYCPSLSGLSPVPCCTQIPGNCPCSGPFGCSAGSSDMKIVHACTEILLPRERKGEGKKKRKEKKPQVKQKNSTRSFTCIETVQT